MGVFETIFLSVVILILFLFFIAIIEKETSETTASVVGLILIAGAIYLSLFFLGRWLEMLGKYSVFEHQLAHVAEVSLVGEKKFHAELLITYKNGKLNSVTIVNGSMMPLK